MFDHNSQIILTQLRADLLEARKARNQLTITTLQALLSAIDNAGAIPVSLVRHSVGVGSTEAARRELSAQDIAQIVAGEIAELKSAIHEMGDAKNPYIDELKSRVAILGKYL